MSTLDRRRPPLYPGHVIIDTAIRIADLANCTACLEDYRTIESLRSSWRTLLNGVGWDLFETTYHAHRKVTQ
jgi:hypothetical protein